VLLRKKPLIWEAHKGQSFAKKTRSCKLEKVLSYYQVGGESPNFLIIEFGKPQLCLT
jgi:hypothetical protein